MRGVRGEPELSRGRPGRRYPPSAAAQGRVEEQAANFQPEFLLNTNPDAVNGPPVVTPNGVVLGGNSRAITLRRVYGARRGAGYKQALVGQARRFGLKPQTIEAMRQPVLVRKLAEPPKSIGQAARLARNLNRNFTGALSDAEMAASLGRRGGTVRGRGRCREWRRSGPSSRWGGCWAQR